MGERICTEEALTRLAHLGCAEIARTLGVSKAAVSQAAKLYGIALTRQTKRKTFVTKLSCDERRDYRTQKTHGATRAEALNAIGRGDLA